MNESQNGPGTGDNKVQLGCGTLILIALIVMIFSGGDEVRDLQHEIQDLKTEVRQLRMAVEEHMDAHSTNTLPATLDEPDADPEP